jgi:hypothetical protein
LEKRLQGLFGASFERVSDLEVTLRASDYFGRAVEKQAVVVLWAVGLGMEGMCLTGDTTTRLRKTNE